MCAPQAARLLSGVSHILCPFAGGLCELAHFDARTMLVSDLNRHAINFANVLRHPALGSMLIRDLRRLPFHEDQLRHSQEACVRIETDGFKYDPEIAGWEVDYTAALNYFICSWMARAGQTGTKGEFRGGLSVRWDAQGGDSVKRFRSATEALRDWRKVFERCTFLVRDAFEMLADAKDVKLNGVFCDPPFPSAGQCYKHNAGTGDAERAWHTRLRDALERFEKARVVCRFYDHDLVRELYSRERWQWVEVSGGKRQTNDAAPEVLLVRNGEAK